MPLVIDTFNDYYFYLQYRRNVVEHTIKANRLALQYFAQLYGYMETEKLLPTHMVRFHEFLLNKKRLQRNDRGQFMPLSRYTVYKVMVKLRAYVKWLESERMLGSLKPIDVPVGNIPLPIPRYLAKEELKRITTYLDENVHNCNERGHKEHRYNAYLYRAIVWFLYTTGLRNNELRTLKFHDLNVHELRGQVL